MGTASGVEDEVTAPKIAGSPAFTPALSASKNLQPLPQHPLPQTLQEADFKELDDPAGYNKFVDVLQVLNSFVIDEKIGQSKNVKGKLMENLEFWELQGASSFMLNVIKFGHRLPFSDVPSAYCSNNNFCTA